MKNHADNDTGDSINSLCAVQQLEWEKQTVKAFAFLTDGSGSANKDRLEALWAVAGNAALIAVSDRGDNSDTRGDAVRVLHTMNLEKIAGMAEKLKESLI